MKISLLHILIKKWVLLIFLLATIKYSLAQTTEIPDSVFEQSLINLGIDSDGIINGQVLTSDINTIVTLDLSQQAALDITGIEDFTALEVLDVTNNSLTSINLSNNIQLRELYISNTGGENLLITSLDLSNNINLEELYSEDLFFLSYLNLKNGNNEELTVTFLCGSGGSGPCELDDLDCVLIDDEIAANSNQPPYNTWFIQADFVYSEDCILNVPDNQEKLFAIYPNPVEDTLILRNKNSNTDQLQIKVFSMQGQLLKSLSASMNSIYSLDVSSYAKGVYFVSIENESGDIESIKFVKK
ncbi:MAG: T9SS type A sorting domain-containing protein [Patiriisocius sp.]|uniref:T9SS type A sorting domain-containing protein n=1 Tax=Patiriisocius sp. TaxID=2822396 RepID=UPI003EF2DB5E